MTIMRNLNRAGKLRIMGSALLVTALATACGGAPSESAAPAAPVAAQQQAQQQSTVDVSLLRQVDNDFAAVESPEKLVESGGHDVIAAGKVVEILQGAEVRAEQGEQYPALTVVMKVGVTEKFRVSSPEQIKDGHVYVTLWQGARFNDAAGTPEHSVADWNRAIPTGTPVMLFLRETDEGIAPGIAGVPAGTKAMAPDVQGLILEEGGKLLGGIEELEGQWTSVGSMKNLGDRIRKQTK